MSSLREGQATVELPAETPAVRVGVSAATHVGRVREANEDSLAVGGWACTGAAGAEVAGTMATVGGFLAVVADGLGGHDSGEVASRLAVTYLSHHVARLVDGPAVAAVLHEADAVVHAEGRRLGAPNAGTTVAGIVVHEGRALAFNVGDSSVWALLGGWGRPLSRADRLPTMGAGGSAGLSQCLGGGTPGVDPHVLELECEPGDRFLLATDGLTDLVETSAMVEGARSPLDAAARHLVDQALAAGGRDNIAVVVLET